MRHLAFVLAVAVAAMACDRNSATGPALSANCAGVGFAAIRVDVRRVDGRPIAAGATLVVTDGSFGQTVTETWSPLTLEAAENRAGRYMVQVSKPYYKTARRVVSVPGGPCGALAPVTVPVTLEALSTHRDVQAGCLTTRHGTAWRHRKRVPCRGVERVDASRNRAGTGQYAAAVDAKITEAAD